MRRPGHNHLRTGSLLVFFNRNQVGKTLQRVAGSRFHAEYRTTGVLDEFGDNLFIVIVRLVFETGKGTDTDDIAVATHDRNSFQQMFRFVTIHDDTTFGFQFPGTLVHVEHHRVHPQVHRSLLGGEAGAQAGVEEYH